MNRSKKQEARSQNVETASLKAELPTADRPPLCRFGPGGDFTMDYNPSAAPPILTATRLRLVGKAILRQVAARLFNHGLHR